MFTAAWGKNLHLKSFTWQSLQSWTRINWHNSIVGNRVMLNFTSWWSGLKIKNKQTTVIRTESRSVSVQTVLFFWGKTFVRFCFFEKNSLKKQIAHVIKPFKLNCSLLASNARRKKVYCEKSSFDVSCSREQGGGMWFTHAKILHVHQFTTEICIPHSSLQSF